METTTLETNKSIARQFFEYFSKGEIQKIENLWGSNYKFHFPGSPKALSKEESKQVLKDYVAAFPDLKFTIDYQVAEGDLVVTRITPSGTHKGSFQGISATNKKVAISGIEVHRIVDGKIEEEWAEFDALGMMKQIGAVPETAYANQEHM